MGPPGFFGGQDISGVLHFVQDRPQNDKSYAILRFFRNCWKGL